MVVRATTGQRMADPMRYDPDSQPLFVLPGIRRFPRTRACLWFLLSLISVARGAGIAGIPLSHQAWSTEEGLPNASVHQILQTRDGYLWIATEGGAARFNGTEFRPVRHEMQPAFTSDDVSSLAQDRHGDLWFGTADGLVQDHEGTFTHYGTQEGLPSAPVESLGLAQDGILLVTTVSGLARWNGRRFVPFQAPPVRLPAKAQDGHLGPAPAELPRGLRATAQLLDRRGARWIGTNHGLFVLGVGGEPHLQPVEALGGSAVLCLAEDREGDVWIGTESSGLHVLRPRKFRADPASLGEVVTAVAVGAGDQVWYGTRDGGLRRATSGRLGGADPVASGALTSPLVLSLAAGSHGDVWVGTPDGLNHVTGSHVQRFTSADGLPDDFVRSVLVDRHGTVWAGTRGGLARLEGDHITTRSQRDGLGSDSVGPLLETWPPPLKATPEQGAQPDLWVGTAAGLSHVTGNRIQSYPPTAGGRTSIVTALAQTGPGELLVAVHAAGLLFFRNGQFVPVPLPRFPSDVHSMVLERQGFVWLRELQQLHRVPLAELRACQGSPCRATLVSFSTADGLPHEAAAAEGSPQLSLAGSGTLWVATRKGLAVADTSTLPRNTVPPPVTLEHFTVDGTDQPLGPAAMTLGPGHGRFIFSFAALSYTLPAKVRYRYRLEGFDRDWIEAGPVHTAYYTSLPAGRYRFVVQAANNDAVWDQQDANIHFRILPPLYRRWWFALLLLLVVGGLVLLILHLRERVVQRRFALVLQERNRMAREIHDTLAQDFVSVSLQLDLAASLLRGQQVEQAALQLQATRSLVKQGLHAARQSIWNLRAGAGEDSLPTRLSTLVTRYAVGGKPPRLDIGGTFRKLPEPVEAEVLRIAQESLSNAERHAGGNEVSVTLFYKVDQLQLTVRDDGKGFSLAEAEKREGHYGLRGMRERAAAIDGDLSLASQPGEGTTITLSIPLQKEAPVS